MEHFYAVVMAGGSGTRFWPLSRKHKPKQTLPILGPATMVRQTVERLFWRAERYNRLVLSTAARFRRSVGYYRAFLEACEQRDGDAAERVIHESMRQTVADLAPSLPSEAE